MKFYQINYTNHKSFNAPFLGVKVKTINKILKYPQLSMLIICVTVIMSISAIRPMVPATLQMATNITNRQCKNYQLGAILKEGSSWFLPRVLVGILNCNCQEV